MHTTDTIDFEVILSGEMILELDDGAETVLHPGDTVVQNGTRHRWGNRGNEPAVMAVFIDRGPPRWPRSRPGVGWALGQTGRICVPSGLLTRTIRAVAVSRRAATGAR